tara:strand:+ start:193 stop:465 length:273 start_codon:yes stop_codon:yes gene_type:complete
MSFTEKELETILYSLEGYIQGNDDEELVAELEDICNKINKELEKKVIAKDENVMTSYNFDEGLYGEIIKDWNYRFPKFSYTNYPKITDTK